MALRRALIIANSAFDDQQLTKLSTPTEDAEALARVLGDPHIGSFEVDLVLNATMVDVRQRVARLFKRRTRDDLLLFYYSGHGLKDEHGDLHLAVRDTNMDIVAATALNASFVRNQIDQSNSRRKVVILDCCYSGAFYRPGAKGVMADQAQTKEAFGAGYGRVILTASNELQYAFETPDASSEAGSSAMASTPGRSVFTHSLVEGLETGNADRDGDGIITLDELYDYAYEQVIRREPHQTPKQYAEIEGRLDIARTPTRVPPLADWVSNALKSKNVGARLTAVSELRELMGREDERQAKLAAGELRRLADEDDDKVVRAAAQGALRRTPSREPRPPVNGRRRRIPLPKLALWIGGIAAALALGLVVRSSLVPSVPPLPTAGLAAEPTTIELGESTTLLWTTTHATEVRLEPEPGLVAAQGSGSVSPERDVTYRLVATGPQRTVEDSVQVIVIAPPPLPTATFAAVPDTVRRGVSDLVLDDRARH